MAEVRAVDLPVWSVVAIRERVWIRVSRAGWQTNGSDAQVTNSRIDAALQSGRATVLRHGDGEEDQ